MLAPWLDVEAGQTGLHLLPGPLGLLHTNSTKQTGGLCRAGKQPEIFLYYLGWSEEDVGASERCYSVMTTMALTISYPQINRTIVITIKKESWSKSRLAIILFLLMLNDMKSG